MNSQHFIRAVLACAVALPNSCAVAPRGPSDTLRIGANRIDMQSAMDARYALSPGPQQLLVTVFSRSAGDIAIDGRTGEQTIVEIHANVGLFFTDYSLRTLSQEDGRRQVAASKLIADRR